MRKLAMLAAGLALLVGLWAIGSTIATAQDVFSNDPNITLMDRCDPATFMGFCVATAHTGDVTFGEFLMLLFSPLIKTVVGHPGWRFEPSYLDIRPGQALRITNRGGEGHTFTEVTAFGGGFVPLLNGAVSPPAPVGTVPLTPAAACFPPSGILGPGETSVRNLSPGRHIFQCCIHPWMRAEVDVGN